MPPQQHTLSMGMSAVKGLQILREEEASRLSTPRSMLSLRWTFRSCFRKGDWLSEARLLNEMEQYVRRAGFGWLSM